MAKVGDLMVSFDPLPGAARVWHAFVDGASWRLTAHQVWEKGGRLIALWGADDGRTLAVHAALGLPEGLFWITLPLSVQSPEYPDLGDLFAPANRMQRAAFDLVGVRARGAEDTRRWLRHTTRRREFGQLYNVSVTLKCQHQLRRAHLLDRQFLQLITFAHALDPIGRNLAHLCDLHAAQVGNPDKLIQAAPNLRFGWLGGRRNRLCGCRLARRIE